MHHIHVCLLLLRNECHGPWRRGSCTGHQSLEVFQIFWKPNSAKIGEKSFKFGRLLLYIRGGNKKKFIFPRFRLIAPERKHFHCVAMIGNTCEPHPTLLSPFASLVSMSLPRSCPLLLIRKKPNRIWRFLPSLGRGVCSGLVTSSHFGFPKEQLVLGLGVQWLREA